MNRLQHSVSATKRALQISRYQLFAFVEGTSDKYFYGELCGALCNGETRYVIYSAAEAPFCKNEIENKKLSGKSGLLELFGCFQRYALLSIELKGKNKVAAFFLDKDIDDFLGKKIASEHLIYTKYYDMESHIFMDGDIIKGAASATNKSAQEVRENIPDADDWMYQVADRWKQYVKICFFAVKSGAATGEYRYGKELLPKIFDATYENNFLSDAVYMECSGLIDRLYKQKEYGYVFKGKWYSGLLDRELTGAKGEHEQIVRCIQATLDFNAAWTQHFKQPLGTLLTKLQ